MTSLSTLIESTAAKIIQMIVSGSLVHTLPGERELGHRLSVGRGTIRGALVLLERQKWISPPKTKLPRTILRTQPVQQDQTQPKTPKKTTIGFLTPQSLTRLSQSVLAELYSVEKILEEDGILVRIFEAPWVLSANPARRLQKLVQSTDCACWVLHRSSEQTQLWFKQHDIPCMVRGTAYKSSKLPYLDRHWEATTHHAAQHLWNKGHRNVGLCLPLEQLRGHHMMAKGFLNFQGEGWNPVIVPMPFSTHDSFENLNKIHAKHPDLSALIATRASQIMPILSWAESHSISIPKQISVISLTYESFMERMLPQISFYESNKTKSVHQFIRMLRGLMAGKIVRSIAVIPDLRPGESVAPVTAPST